MLKKNFKILMFAFIIISLVLCIFIYKNNYKIKLSEKTWSDYDKSLENIKKNMDEITEDSENWIWWTLKENNITDLDFKNAINSLIGDIRMCYIYSSNDDNYRGNVKSNPLLKYKEEKTITKKQVESLQIETKIDYCLEVFEKYNLFMISSDKTIDESFKAQVNKVYELQKSELFKIENPTYDEMVEKEVLKLKKISELTNWLKLEYDKYKK